MLRIVRVLAPNPGVFELEGTNTWIVGPDPAIVIDPGPEHEGHLSEVQRTAGRIGEIVLTHDHPDHAPGALRLREMTGAPIRAARPVEGMEPLRDGEVVRSGLASLSVVATPGHSADHVAFFGSQDGALFTGDAVLGRGTSVIDPPEGDLAAYLRSLHRMRELAPRTIYPGHGPVVLRAMAKLEEYVEHRAMRERQVLEALGGERRTPQELVADIYRDYPPEVHEAAARSVLAHLLKLESEGLAEKRSRDGVVRWSRIEPRSCERCGRPVRGRARFCGPCSLAVLQESG
ncbi:MAG TPA: MBL fold metallo-hydrolase [Actinomycetota bacterium]|nr:MBL fold metallo-hydrolase [Actinomycetota bacterium]